MWRLDPVLLRRKIPFFTLKTEEQFRLDPYERYREVVMRQAAIHLADDYWGCYPFQAVADWVIARLPSPFTGQLADIGCGIGRLLREIAEARPNSSLYGIDFSYNQLRVAYECWVEGKTIEIDWRERGLPLLPFSPKPIPHLELGLAKADELPFADASLDVICNTFLLDRLHYPPSALQEWKRVLRPDGQLLMLSPLNWRDLTNWEEWGTKEKVVRQFELSGWKIIETAQFSCREPMDARGNLVEWQVLAIQASF